MPETAKANRDEDRGRLSINGVDIPIDMRLRDDDQEKIDQAGMLLRVIFGSESRRLTDIFVAAYLLARLEESKRMLTTEVPAPPAEASPA